jgi:hypothetical protein
MRAVGAELEGRVGGVQIVRGWKLVRATLLSAAVCAGLFGIVSPAWARTKLRIADPGRASARVVRCSSSFDTDCGGSIEINGQEYGFAGGALAGRVDSSGRFGRGHASFGVASTDPATQGPFQLRFSLVTAGSASGRFVSSGSPLGVGAVSGLYFEFSVPFYIRVSGANDVEGPASGVGAGCTIGDSARPLKATFVSTLSSFFSGGGGGVPYDQATGIADLSTKTLALPGIQDCAGQESSIDQQLGLPGPGLIQIFLRFSPAVVSTAYRAAHPRGRHHRRRMSESAPPGRAAR